jgi:hypothetical protein
MGDHHLKLTRALAVLVTTKGLVETTRDLSVIGLSSRQIASKILRHLIYKMTINTLSLWFERDSIVDIMIRMCDT